MLAIRALMAAAGGGASEVEILYIGTTANTADLTVYTFSSHNIGTASADRVVIIGVNGNSGNNGLTISSATVGGNAATAIVQATGADSGGSFISGIYAIAVAAGTAADIVVTFSGSMIRAAVSVHTMTGTGGSVTASDSASDNTGTLSTNTLDIPARGAAVGITCANKTSIGTVTWVGLTEDNDQNFENANNTYSAAHGNFATAQTNLTVSASYSGGTPDSASLVVASWGPA